jgi:hypothetical protein
VEKLFPTAPFHEASLLPCRASLVENTAICSEKQRHI